MDILKYNPLYSAIIQSEPRFKLEAQIEFDKARKVIRNAIKRGEIKKIPENFIGATILANFNVKPSENEIGTPINELLK